MSDREKTLAVLVAVLLIACGAFFGYRSMHDAFVLRQRQITALQNELAKQQARLLAGQQARQRVERISRIAFPPNQQRARSTYQSWLLQTIVETGFRDPDLRAASTSIQRNEFQQLSYRITGRGTLEQVVKWLYAFYDAGYAHRVGHLVLTPVQDSDRLDIVLRIDLLLLPRGAASTDSFASSSERLRHNSLAYYVKTVAHRQLFQPRNRPPVFTDPGPQNAVAGTPWRYQVQASDPDASDQLQFELVPPIPEGVSIDRNSGLIMWNPGKAGKFEVIVAVDDGSKPPSKQSGESRDGHRPLSTIQVAVADPPDETTEKHSPKLRLSGIVEGNRRIVYLVDGESGRTISLSEGGQADVARQRIEIVKIERRRVLLKLDGIEQWVAVGSSTN